jgi:hypothetical protein
MHTFVRGAIYILEAVLTFDRVNVLNFIDSYGWFKIIHSFVIDAGCQLCFGNRNEENG